MLRAQECVLSFVQLRFGVETSPERWQTSWTFRSAGKKVCACPEAHSRVRYTLTLDFWSQGYT